MAFNYEGILHSSKSMVNRLLILQRAFPELSLNFSTNSQDVLDLQRLLNEFDSGQTEFDVGNGGTTFRFFSFWLSRQPGDWKLNLGEQLSLRPQTEIIQCLKQVGIKAYMDQPSIFRIEGGKWDMGQTIEIDLRQSTQFLSGFLLAASAEQKSFAIKIKNKIESSGYENITFDLLKRLDFKVHETENQLEISPPKTISYEFQVGADWSSLFYLSLFAFSGNTIRVTNVDFLSPEPDRLGYEVLLNMGLSFEKIGSSMLLVKPSKLELKTRTFDFRKNPDLFPGFCALISQLNQSDLSAPITVIFPWQLKIKESDRLKNSLEILKTFGLSFSIHNENQLFINGKEDRNLTQPLEIATDDDHRMFMSAEFLRSRGYKVKTTEEISFKKSFPEFLEIVRG